MLEPTVNTEDDDISKLVDFGSNHEIGKEDWRDLRGLTRFCVKKLA